MKGRKKQIKMQKIWSLHQPVLTDKLTLLLASGHKQQLKVANAP